MRTANLLPWRQRQKSHRLRFWSVLFSGSLLLTLMLWASLRIATSLQEQIFAQRQASDLALKQALAQRQKQWTARRARDQQQQRWAQQKAKTEAWQRVLIALARTLPEQAWLAQLRFQQSTLSLSGYAATLPALAGLETALRQLPGFIPGAPGEMHQDTQGRWHFSWTLTRKEQADADPL
ncbi:PilN domain-containing protein [Leclercia adecarboxylata]|uniref:PilN domain-containing protein n=1 Tax=Leclercia adecarboxylata TaxID=83655 RepID=UPI002DB84552|nr:PilN domain-containing protein [Leclercia adecarboxylata]MEB6381238.1 PilN domain-containing protein [Leclercia adecarboxylata]